MISIRRSEAYRGLHFNDIGWKCVFNVRFMA